MPKDNGKARQRREKRDKQQKGPALVEWISAGVGALVTLGIMLFIALEAIGPSAAFPVISVRPLAVGEAGGQYVVQVEVRNDSAETASALQIEGELSGGGGVVETSQATLSYVPGNSSRRAGLIFSGDPRGGRLRIRATGYELP